jgi:DNA-binding transcriptional MerR regulator
MSENDLYDPKTVSGMIDVPTSTIRRYAAQWSEFLSPAAQVSGQKRRYTNQDVLILKRIKDLVRARKPENEIKDALQLVQESPEEIEQPESTLALIPQIAEEFDRLRSLTAEQNQKLSDFRADVATSQMTQSSEIHALRSEIQELKKLIQDIQEKDEQNKTPWYKRIFR